MCVCVHKKPVKWINDFVVYNTCLMVGYTTTQSHSNEAKRQYSGAFKFGCVLECLCTVEWLPSIHAVRTKLNMLSICNENNNNNNEMDFIPNLIHKEGQGERLFFYNCILCDFIICFFSSPSNVIVQVSPVFKRNDRICTHWEQQQYSGESMGDGAIAN